jgi:putative hemolysin
MQVLFRRLITTFMEFASIILMKTIKVIFLIFILAMVGTGTYFFSANKNKSINDNTTTSPIEVPTANMPNPASVYCNDNGGTSVIRTASDGSQSGVCVFADGKECDEWLFFRGECNAISGTEKAIQAFLANKYKRPISEVKVTVQKEAPGFASGSVSFGEGGLGEGGMWLAVAGNQWDVVWDGNGSIDCNKMRQQYGFPDSILKPNFCD